MVLNSLPKEISGIQKFVFKKGVTFGTPCIKTCTMTRKQRFLRYTTLID